MHYSWPITHHFSIHTPPLPNILLASVQIYSYDVIVDFSDHFKSE